MSYFKTGTPESQGITSDGLIDFLKAVKENGLELHRLMVIRHGVCVTKACADPYREDQLHPVYSFTKSFTSTAIGFAIQEGLLTLDDKLTEFFPDKLPANPSENLKKCRIRHLLSMSCGHETEISSDGADWLEKFLAHPFVYEPGTFFLYNSAGTNVLSAVIQKVTGQDLLSYLKPRLFDPLGFGEVFCARLKDEYQTCLGGGGMKLQLEDMAKFTQFMLQNGEWEGQKLLNGWYEQMSTIQIETAGDSAGHIRDWAQGYGFQCWMCMPEKSYRADGAFGQFGLVFPTLDLIVITNMATEMTQTFMDIVNEILLPSIKADSIPENPSAQHRLSSVLKNLHVPALTGCRNPSMEKWMEGKIFSSGKQSADEYVNSFDTLIGGSGLFDHDDETEISGMQFSFSDDEVIWSVQDGDTEKVIHASFSGKFIYSVADGLTYASTARWRSRTALEMEVRRMDAISGCRMIFRINEASGALHIEPEDTLITDGGLGITKRAMPVFEEGKYLSEQKTVSYMMQKMMEYSEGSLHDINHFMKVYTYAKTIGELEGLDSERQIILEVAAILHDIACPELRKQYGHANGKMQEKAGIPLAEALLNDPGLTLNTDQKNRIVFLVGHHHTLDEIDGPDYQILIEADYLVNADEGKYAKENIQNTYDTVFKTTTGKKLLKSIYLPAYLSAD